MQAAVSGLFGPGTMRKLLRKKTDPTPEHGSEARLQAQRPPTKVTGIGEHQTPLYARFASAQSAAKSSSPVISGPVSLSARADSGARARSGRNETPSHRQSYNRQTSSAASKAPKTDKPLPVADFRDGKPLPIPAPPEQKPDQQFHIPSFEDFNSREQEPTKTIPEPFWDAGPGATSTKRNSDNISLNGIPFVPSPTSIPRPSASVSQRYEAPAELRPRVMESRSGSGSGQQDLNSDSFNRSASRKKFSPMAAFGLGSVPEPQKVSMKGSRSSLQSNSTTTPISSQVRLQLPLICYRIQCHPSSSCGSSLEPAI